MGVAICLHIVLSIIYGTFLALVMPTVSAALGILLGGLYGLALYYINFYGFNAFSPWFVDHRDWLNIVSHCVFGAVLAYAYTALNTRRFTGLPIRQRVRRPTKVLERSDWIQTVTTRTSDSLKEKWRTCRSWFPIARGSDLKMLPYPSSGSLPCPRSFYPRLSEARHLLPLLRSHLIAAASRHPLAAGLALDLLPIVEDGLFGYELLPDRETHTYVTMGCNAQGEPVLRKTLYGVGAPNALQLVAVNGHILSSSERAARYSTQQRDYHFSDWPAAVESAWAHLLLLFPERPRQPVAVREHMHRCLDEASVDRSLASGALEPLHSVLRPAQ